MEIALQCPDVCITSVEQATLWDPKRLIIISASRSNPKHLPDHLLFEDKWYTYQHSTWDYDEGKGCYNRLSHYIAGKNIVRRHYGD